MDRICPLSFAFSVRSAPQILSPQVAKLQVKIGFSCIREKCAWWDDTAQQCRLLTVQFLLEEILKELKQNERK